MKTTLKLVAAALVVFGMSSAVQAFDLTYRLTQLPGDTWTLEAKTDAPGGIASFAVDLVGATSGTSVAPRAQLFGGDVRAFTQGNLGSTTTPTWENGAVVGAFAGQNTSSSPTLVYGLGFADVADADLAPAGTEKVGSGIRNAEGYITLYTGTGLADYASAQPAAAGALWATPNPTPITPDAPTGVERILVPIPEPGTIVLAGLAIPALAFALRRRKAA